MRRTLRTLLLAIAALSAANLAGRPNRPAPPVPGASWLAAGPPALVHRTQCPEHRNAADPRPLVWVVDGAGDLRGCSNALVQANLLAGTPIEVSTFNWSHGHRRLLADQVDAGHARDQGKRLAALIRERQAREPGRRVVLVSHSAGCAVTLAAGDYLPADSIDRVVMFAPSVSVGYDLRPSLRAAREGVDVFCSKKDWVALGLVTRVVGTTDRFGAAAAGRNGFRADTVTDADVPLLRQHFWTADVAWTGHTGGHHGMYSATFLHHYLFPLVGVSVR
ncbi:MAG TPA: alpha/beta hydrolase [Urbifossiella sp.]|nr:alpha/beta hydrolase [Urbifossiella sp.]